MGSTLDIHGIMHLNLFEKITRVNTRFFFEYNDTFVFCVPRMLVSKAIGEGGRNVKELNSILGKKIKVIAIPDGINDARSFVEDVVSPLTFKNFEVTDNEVIITAGNQSKAALIGRNKRRLIELQKIVKDNFGKELRVV